MDAENPDPQPQQDLAQRAPKARGRRLGAPSARVASAPAYYSLKLPALLLVVSMVLQQGAAIAVEAGFGPEVGPFAQRQLPDSELTLYAGSVLVFCVLALVWFALAWGNLWALEAGDQAVPKGVAVVIWFVPVVNAIVGSLMLLTLWRASGPLKPGETSWRDNRLRVLIGGIGFMLAFGISAYAGQQTFPAGSGDPDPEALFTLMTQPWAYAVLGLEVGYVVTISRWQHQKHLALAARPPQTSMGDLWGATRPNL